MAGPTENPPPHTQADLGVGGRVRERELRPRDHVTSYVITRPCHVTVSRQRGGDPPRHRSRDTNFIGEEMRALGLIGPMPGKGSKYCNTGIRTFLAYMHSRAILSHDNHFCLLHAYY